MGNIVWKFCLPEGSVFPLVPDPHLSAEGSFLVKVAFLGLGMESQAAGEKILPPSAPIFHCSEKSHLWVVGRGTEQVSLSWPVEDCIAKNL